jgi:quercetin dioxygenase-like cupin family protein
MSANVTVGPDGSPVELGPVGQEVVFENDQVRIWEISLEPGEQQSWHHHLNPYVVIALEAADNRIDALAGGEPRLVHEPVGGIVYREPGEVHKLTNHGRTTYRSRLIELKFLGEAAPRHDDPQEAR